jgi:hypothetical protein
MDQQIDRLIAEWNLVAPVPRSVARGRPIANRLHELSGARGAFLEYSKDNAFTLLQELAGS